MNRREHGSRARVVLEDGLMVLEDELMALDKASRAWLSCRSGIGGRADGLG